jgi:hypothetical protein
LVYGRPFSWQNTRLFSCQSAPRSRLARVPPAHGESSAHLTAHGDAGLRILMHD